MKTAVLELAGCLFVLSGLCSILLAANSGWQSDYVVWVATIAASGFIWISYLKSSWPERPAMFAAMPYWNRAISLVIITIAAMAVVGTTLEMEWDIFKMYSVTAVCLGLGRITAAHITTKYVQFKFEDETSS